MSQRPSEQLQLVIESLALNHLKLICDFNPEGAEMIESVRARMALEQIRINAQVTPALVMGYFKEKYSDGPAGPVKTNSGL